MFNELSIENETTCSSSSEMSPDEYEIHELIGEGSFGKVYKARNRTSHNIVAYKLICKTGRRISEVEALRKECEIQKNLKHPNIIRMLDSFETREALVVITEFALKDLCQILKEEGVLSETRAGKITKDLVSALYYLHSHRILHRDLKPPNVLLDSSNSAKLCDFGFAKFLGNDDSVLTSIKGTPLYMAPELMNESPYDHTADLWSLGCITYQLVTGRPPYTTSSILHLIKMIKLEPIKWPNYLSESCLSFLKGLLQKDPLHRLSWPHLQHHPYIYNKSADHSADSNVNGSFSSFQNSLLQPRKMNGSSNYVFNKTGVTKTQTISMPEKTDVSVPFEKKQENNFERDHLCSKKCENDPDNIELSVRREEWLEFLRQTIQNVMCAGDVDVLKEKHSLKLVMNAFNSCFSCPFVLTTVTRLLSLPFVVESVSENNMLAVKQTFVECEIMKDLLTMVKYIITNKVDNQKIDTCHEVALQQLMLLIRYLVFTDEIMLHQFYSISFSLNVFSVKKNCLIVWNGADPFSIVKHIIAIFFRLYITIPESRSYVFNAFANCINEFHVVLLNCDDTDVIMKLCTFVFVLCSTQPNFSERIDLIQILVKDFSVLKKRNKVPLDPQIDVTLEILKAIGKKQ